MKFNWKYVAVASSVLLVACQKQMGEEMSMKKDTTQMTTQAMKQDEMNKEKDMKQMDDNKTSDNMKGEMKMVDATFNDLEGKTVSLADYRGKKVYLKFWASWCPICLAGLADINELAGTPMEDAVVLSVVAPGVNNEKNLDDFKKWYGGLEYKNLPVLVDKDGAFLKQLGVVGYPTSAFVNANGELVRVQPGHLSSEEIQSVLATL